MSNEVEMNEVTTPLLENGSIKENNENKIPNVEFKDSKSNENLVKETFTGLSKEELEKYANDPFWIRLRKILFALFWLIWAGMLIAAILIVVLSPKCPKRPKLEFWEKKTGYWVDISAFVDSDNNNVGDIEGLINRLDYIQKEVGAGYLILDPVFSGQYSSKVYGSVNSFRIIDSSIGDLKSFQKMIKEGRKRGLEIVLAIDFNALHSSSDFFNGNSSRTITYNEKLQTWVSRDGKSSKRNIKGRDVYSSSPITSSMIDLNLRNEDVLNEIKESVKMWLNTGVRGFLLTNVAFYVENISLPTSQNVITSNNNYSAWYFNQSINSQIFSPDTKYFLKEIRQVMNEVAKKTDKSRVLIVEAGNVGFGLTQSNVPDLMLKYLDDQDKIADMIVGREFLRNRGWNQDNFDYSTSSVRNYLSMTPAENRSQIALMSATSTSLRTTNLLKLAAPFLLPGNPIIYFGTEIGIQCDLLLIKSIKVPFYPQNRSFPLEDVEGEWPLKCNHMIMPWDNNGNGFYNGKNNSIDDYITSATDTVQALTAVGRHESILQLHKKLIKVREEPSLQWGKIEMFPNENIKKGTYEIFIREAEGFPKIIVAFIQDDRFGKVFSFTSICAKVTPLLVYPSNPNLPENKEVPADNIFLQIKGGESIHVFKCAM